MTISFDSNLLTAYYNAKAGLGTTNANASGTTGASTPSTPTASPTGSAKAPPAPWSSGQTATQGNDLVSQVLLGHRFIPTDATTGNAAGASPDYSKLFSLYQGLSALQGLAEKAQSGKLSPNALAQVQRRFAAGMSEVQAYIGSTKYDHVDLTEGTLTQDLKSTVGIAKTNTTYTADALVSGSATAPVKAFDGDVKFTITAKKTGKPDPIAVNIDLSEMGSTVRSMSNVVGFINDKLKAAGLSTRMAVNRTPATPTTTTLNGKTTTLSAGQDSYGLQIKGVPYEQLTLSAPTTADAVYVVQTTGDPNKKLTPATPTTSNADATASSDAKDKKTTDVSAQLVKFQADNAGGALSDPISKVGDTYWFKGESQQTQLPDTIANVRQSIAGPAGSVYVLADVNGQISNQDIKGTQDVALMKYDSAGNLVYTRTLGASDAASGYAMAVSADGKVAIAGSVTGALDVSSTTTKTYTDANGKVVASATSTTNQSVNGASPTTLDSFVTVYDPAGVEQWTQRRGAVKADEATAVAFGDDGSVYVGGRTQSAMPGAGATAGGWDAYLMGFSADGKPSFTTQGGTAQSDSVSGIVVKGNTVYTSGIEGGEVVVKSYAIATSPSTTTKINADGSTSVIATTKTTATQTGSRNLGGIGGGTISGMALIGGQIYLGGSSGSGKLLAGGTTTHDYSGGYDAFALSIDADLKTANPSSSTIAYFGGAGAEKDAKVQFTSDGTAWIAGSTTGDIAGTTTVAKGTTTANTPRTDAYLAKLNIATGTATSMARYTGLDGVVQPNAIAVSSGSSSVLDRLGLPQGVLQYNDASTIVSGTSVRTGDQFYLVDPGTNTKKTITIDAGDTLNDLAKKITRASGYKLKVSVTQVMGMPMNQLDIKPGSSSSKMELVAGPNGRDALAGLGLEAGIVSADAGKPMDASSSGYLKSQKEMGLNFDKALNLNSDAGIAAAVDSLKTTIKNVQKVYTYLKYGDPQTNNNANAHGKKGGPVPAYLTNQIASYTAALKRLTG